MNYLKALLLLLAVAFGLNASAQRYVGGDISALTKHESFHPTWLDADGNSTTPMQIFKDAQLNCMRVRLFVNPDDYAGTTWAQDTFACQNLAYVKVLAKEIKDNGFKFMLDFHYSDYWADVAKQWTPKAWASLSDEELYAKIYDYTKDVLTELKEQGTAPDFIQTGNEISYGMLWGAYGSSTSSLKPCYYNSSDANWSRFTTLLSKAGSACREVCPDAKIILHVERITELYKITNFFNKMKAANVDYDIIGLSYYPIWHNTISTLESVLNSLETNYSDKDIMIVETGVAYSWLPENPSYTPSYALSEAGQQQFIQELITMLNKHSKVTGLFWWWPEYNAYPWSTTQLSDWWYAPLINSSTGKPLAAMSELKNFLTTDGINKVERNCIPEADKKWFTLSGQQIAAPSQGGLYVYGNQKIVVK